MVKTEKQKTLKGVMTHYWKAQATLPDTLIEVKDTGGESQKMPRYEVQVNGQIQIQCSASNLDVLEITLEQVYDYSKGSAVWIPIIEIE